jgi:small subunit ribosomal protein S1
MGSAGASDAMIGQKIALKFLEVNQQANKLVVSNRRAVIEHSMASIKRGDVYSGIVTAVKAYGAFVEIKGMSGLLHISQISYDRVENLESTLTSGMTIKCMVIDHDKAAGRIALSTKTLEPEPGDMLRDPERVFGLAEDTAAKYHARTAMLNIYSLVA